MAQCLTLTRDMLLDPIDVSTHTEGLDFASARLLADARARQVTSDPMLLAWYDRQTGDASPRVECCDEKKPGWLIYAESRGGNIVISINREQYVFIYRETS